MRVIPLSIAAAALLAGPLSASAQTEPLRPPPPAAAPAPRTVAAPPRQDGNETPGITIVMQPRSGPPPVRDDTPFTPPDVPSFLLNGVRPDMTLEEFVSNAASALRRADLGADGLDGDDVLLAELVPQAEARARTLPQALKFDLDGDFTVTRSEIERATRGNPAERAGAADRLLERFDADRDGTITLAEAGDAARPFSGGRNEGLLQAMLDADPDGDGKITVEELYAMARPVFAGVDRDGDGLVSIEEYKAAAGEIRAATTLAQKEPCPVPLPPEGAKVMVLSAYEGAAISSSYVGGADMETNLIDVSIEPGADPLYLVMTSYESNVWRVSGDIGRVAQAVVNSLTAVGDESPGPEGKGDRKVSAAGVSGLPANRVAIVEPDCWRYFSRTNNAEATMALSLIAASVKRKVDVALSSYAFDKVSLPSGEVTQARESDPAMPEGFDPQTWTDTVRFWPGGLATVDPASIVAKAPVASYAVLPSQMGLAQLVGAGAMERIDGRTFRIVKPIAHLPPRMTGSHSATLLLAEGVPLPPGDPGHACIRRAESDEPQAGHCRVPPPAPIIRSVR